MDVELVDAYSNIVKANILFTHYDLSFDKSYVIYEIDNDLLAASYEIVNDKFVLDDNLTSSEYDIIDKEINKKLGESYG